MINKTNEKNKNSNSSKNLISEKENMSTIHQTIPLNNNYNTIVIIK